MGKKIFNYNKYSTLVQDVDSGEDCMCERKRRGLYTFCSVFAMNLKVF